MTICDFQFKRTENHNFTNNQYEPAFGTLSLFDISSFFPYINRSGSKTPHVGGDANLPGVPTYDFAKFSKKLHEIEKSLDRGGGVGVGHPP